MNNININSGEIKLTINDDESRVVSFNPSDLQFIDRFYSLVADFETKEKEYKQKEKEIIKNKDVDSYGIPKNFKEKLELIQEICQYLRDKIDAVFGEGTSQKTFGNTNTLDMFEQFFNGIAPYIQQSRNEKVNKYTKPNKKNVMK